MNAKRKTRIIFFLGLFGYILAFFSNPLFFVLLFFVSSALIVMAGLSAFLSFVKRSRRDKFLAVAALCAIILYGMGEINFPFLFNKIDFIGKSARHRTADLEQFRSLPYASWSNKDADAEVKGVVKYDPAKAFPGYNFYTDMTRYAFLMDMAGNIVHRWRFPSSIRGEWQVAKLQEDGNIIAVCTEKCVAKIDRNSKVIWITVIRGHHDVAALQDGGYLIPVAEPGVGYRSRLVTFDSVVRLSADGEVLEKWSTREELPLLKKLHDPLPLDSRSFRPTTALREIYLFIQKTYTFAHSLRKNPPQDIRQSPQQKDAGPATRRLAFSERIVGKLRDKIEKAIDLKESYDYYHLNTVEFLPQTALGTRDARFQQGNLLICLRNANLILILDKDTKQVVWHWGPGVLDWPHMPTLLENGNILVYDNGEQRSYSRIVELNPTSGSIEWEYRASPPEMFHSQIKGSNQRLPNGNTLICESQNGHAFEVTRDKEIVWEFYSPEIKKGRRKSIYRMMRITDQKLLRSLLS